MNTLYQEKKYDIELKNDDSTYAYVLSFPFSNAISLMCYVEANNLQEALDILADYLVEEDISHNFWSDYYEVQDNMDSDYDTVEEYAEANNLIYVGNTGVYMQCPTLIWETRKNKNEFLNDLHMEQCEQM